MLHQVEVSGYPFSTVQADLDITLPYWPESITGKIVEVDLVQGIPKPWLGMQVIFVLVHLPATADSSSCAKVTPYRLNRLDKDGLELIKHNPSEQQEIQSGEWQSDGRLPGTYT